MTVKNFNSLNIHPELLSALEKNNFITPTEFQSNFLSETVNNPKTNLQGIATTGSGKTLSFVIPIIDSILKLASKQTNSNETRDFNKNNHKLKFEELNKILTENYSTSIDNNISNIRHNYTYKNNSIHSLIVSPTRELCIQIFTLISLLGEEFGLRTVLLIGGDDFSLQKKSLSSKPHIIIGTAGRIADHKIDLNNLSFLVVDEADKIVSGGMSEDLRKILSSTKTSIFNLLPNTTEEEKEEQNIISVLDYKIFLFSATGSKRMKTFFESLKFSCRQFKEINLQKRLKIFEGFVFCPAKQKIFYLLNLLEKYKNDSLAFLDDENKKFLEEEKKAVIVFSNSANIVQTIGETLGSVGYSVQSLFGDLNMNIRRKRVEAFKSFHGNTNNIINSQLDNINNSQLDSNINIKSNIKSNNKLLNILIATDVASRGLDIDNLPLIINYDLPDFTSYTHRIGRTGRNSKKGVAISLVTQYNIVSLQLIEHKKKEKLTKLNIKKEEITERKDFEVVERTFGKNYKKFDVKNKNKKVKK